jgi:GT2 family glycosyltransferase
VTSFLNATTDAQLYLIDNSPSSQYQRSFSHPRIRYHHNSKNVGFGAGHNIVLRQILQSENHRYHLILNPDVYFTSGVITQLIAYMSTDNSVGLLMPKVLYPDGNIQRLCKLLPSPTTLFARRFLKFSPFWMNRLNHLYEMHFTDYNKIMDVPFLSGCFMFLRVEALRKVGIFDEKIFLYTEDTDLSRRIHQFYRTVFYPEVSIYHHNEKASYKNAMMLLHHIRSAITYFNKWGWFNDSERDLINQQTVMKLTR